jgi:hypothetical protein
VLYFCADIFLRKKPGIRIVAATIAAAPIHIIIFLKMLLLIADTSFEDII